MSMLASLVRAYDRLPWKPPYGFAVQNIGYCVVLTPDGAVAEVVDLRDTDKKRSPRQMAVPACPKRAGVTPRPNFLWDNVNYALGAGTLTDPEDKRFEAFRDKHLEFLEAVEDAEVQSFCAFLRSWSPEALSQHFDLEILPTAGIVFAMAGSYRDHCLHDAPALRSVWLSERERWTAVEGKAAAEAVCLVSGRRSAIARTHPPIKGVWGAQVAGAAIVTFNSDAYESYGHEQGDNAPVSEAAAFAYTTALNRFLDKDSGHRIQIGDASTVFWADAAEAEAAALAEAFFGEFFDASASEKINTDRIGAQLERIRRGEPLSEVAPQLDQGVTFCVLGLAPNAARLSVRFWWESSFGTLTRHYQRFVEDMRLDPPPRDGWPPLWRYLVELAAQGKRENVPPLIAGEWMRAILTGTAYPLTLLSTTLMRIRADGEINALRAAMLKSVLIRNFAKEVPVALDPGNTNKGYILGRLFAVYEEVQRAALGGNVNATIKDKFYGAASAAPQKVFRTLDAGAQNHFAKLRKLSPGRAVNLEKLLTSITDLMEPGNDPIPASLASAEQALFGIGYYHQRSDFFRKHDDTPITEADQ
ncbi:CRISPR-associated Csd1 family protein [Rhodobacter viridis]|uniref:CRISPR-associated Csd1 family protein n=1 Tax=Rhodobacter viridis TaxID=1054202 RepID=A0A318UBN5_9RHOB|nr:type I-C CRISPR-associated protein Cas8c/Csd1 [Rhodobacter viridis]PYF09570.1 CRISPR-associated Csd1 family protein [Rhodobacter viridis]